MELSEGQVPLFGTASGVPRYGHYQGDATDERAPSEEDVLQQGANSLRTRTMNHRASLNATVATEASR